MKRVGTRVSGSAMLTNNKAERAAVSETILGKVADMGKPALCPEKPKKEKRVKVGLLGLLCLGLAWLCVART